jgi:hypothetical protein
VETAPVPLISSVEVEPNAPFSPILIPPVLVHEPPLTFTMPDPEKELPIQPDVLVTAPTPLISMVPFPLLPIINCPPVSQIGELAEPGYTLPVVITSWASAVEAPATKMHAAKSRIERVYPHPMRSPYQCR